MKKALALLLTVCLVFSFAACGKNGSGDDSSKIKHSVEVAKLAGEGRIPEVDFVVGDPVEGVKDRLFKLGSGMSYDEFIANMKKAGHKPTGNEYDSYILTQKKDGHTIMSTTFNNDQSIYCMYNTENEKSGIAAIAIVGDAYGYNSNTLKKYVTGSIDSKYKTIKAQSDLEFLPKESDGATAISYEMGMYKLEFYFSSYDTLAATVLYDTNIW